MNRLLKNKKLQVDYFSKINLIIFGIVFAVIGGYVLYLSFAATATVNLVGNCTPDPSWGTIQASFEQQVVSLVNQHRVNDLHIQALAVAPSLQASADWKSMNMAGLKYMDHPDPVQPGLPNGRSVADRFVTCGYPSAAGWGENIAYGYTDPQSVETAWLSDIGHKANIENTSWTCIGVGSALGSDGLIYWTEDFGTTGCTTGGGNPNDHTPPSVPTNLQVTAQSGTAISFSWTASTDDSGFAPQYTVYLNGNKLGITGVITGTIGGLTCGTTYTFGVDAFDGNNNHSAIATKNGTTQSCGGGGGTKPGDCNGDGKVELLDLSSVLGNWNTNFPACDFDKSGTVDLLDLSTVLGNWTG